ncbi:MAG: peptide deformylase [Ignavibacteria bacterium]|nr:peptide deformylase [Ignavibacteria bacterium]
MAILPIYNCFHPVLKKKTEEVTNFDGELKKFVDDMLETMYHADGIGLAANQVGHSKSVIVLDMSVSNDDKYRNAKPIIMINPRIHSFSEEEVELSEGCLSVPKFFEDVSRPAQIQVQYWDIDMKEYKSEEGDFVSRVMQHEIDHLNGILFFEKLSPLRRALSRSKLRKIEKGDTLSFYSMILPNGKLIEREVE